MHRGYTKRWRKRWDKGYHQDILLWVMMDYFIDFATYKDKQFPFIRKGALVEMVELKRGQCFFTFKGIKDFFNSPLNPVSRKQVRRRVNILEKIDFLELHQGHYYQIATILNYDRYNPLQKDKAHEEGRECAHEGEHQEGHQSPTTNNIKNNKKVNKRTIGKFIPPVLDEVIKYFIDNGYTKESAIKAFKYYNNAEPPWTDSKGNKVRGWKQKMIGVWFKPENENKEQVYVPIKETPTPDYLKDLVANIGKEIK